MKRIVNLPDNMKIDSSQIGLPTNGAEVKTVTHNENMKCYSVVGEIKPVDPEAPVIEFQVNLPEQWNKKAVHYGGSGCDGMLVTGLDAGSFNPMNLPAAAKGYVTFGSDGGHKAAKGDSYDCSFAINDEAFRNFGHEALKKTKDVMAAIVGHTYGTIPAYVYFSGGSNGGREALKAIQVYPDDYDAIVCQYPVLNWVGKSIMDSRNGDLMEQPGHWMEQEKVDKLLALRQKVYAGYCTNEHGIVCDLEKAGDKREEVREKAREFLSDKQIEMLDLMEQPLVLPYELANGIKEVPGYLPWTGTVVSDMVYNQMGQMPDARSGDMTRFGDAVIRYMVMKDENFAPSHFNYVRYKAEVQAASAILDATDPAIDRFVNKGGKIILLHGMEDQLVSLESSAAYVRALREHFGAEKTDEFCRFYLVPGMGHGIGFNFAMYFDSLQALDDWVVGGNSPEELTVSDETPYVTAFAQAYVSPEGLASMKIPEHVKMRTQVIEPVKELKQRERGGC